MTAGATGDGVREGCALIGEGVYEIVVAGLCGSGFCVRGPGLSFLRQQQMRSTETTNSRAPRTYTGI